MRTDPATIPTDSRLEAEVAVVGAGPAGIVLALELARAGHSVLLIDSGGDSPNPDLQRLGELVGHDPAHVSMSLATSRQLGGASNLWGGRCVPFDPIDFKPRAIVDESRWPVTYEELAPYFQRACNWFVCGEAVFDAQDIQTSRRARSSPVSLTGMFGPRHLSAGRCRPTSAVSTATR